jgi:hypothetical protein
MEQHDDTHPGVISTIMASIDRLRLLILFLSVLIGMAAGRWGRAFFGDGPAGVLLTLAGTVAAYYAITAALRLAGHTVE